MTFGEGTKFTATGRKKVDTVIIVQIKVFKSSITDVIRMELDSHADTCLLGKESLIVYDWNFLSMYLAGIQRTGSSYVKLSQGQ